MRSETQSEIVKHTTNSVTSHRVLELLQLNPVILEVNNLKIVKIASVFTVLCGSSAIRNSKHCFARTDTILR